MATKVLPTLFVGLGDLGQEVLTQLDKSIREAYGPAALDAVALLGMDFSRQHHHQ